jgi:hypothetical protein
MQKLTQETREDIASRITSILANEIMASISTKDGDFTKARYWRDMIDQVVIELFDDYGIKLPTYELALEYAKQEK